MNNKGMAAFVMLMLGVTFFILGLALANPLKLVIVEASTTAELNCTTPPSYYEQTVCTAMDFIHPFYIGLIFGFAGIVIGRLMG